MPAKQKPTKSKQIIPAAIIEKKIYLFRGYKVMMDYDLAELYCVETRQLNRQVQRNIDRFPSEFMLTLAQEEFANLKCQIGTSRWSI